MAINEYETEEQQVEALKKWWKENGTSIIVGLFVGVSALFGWRYYVDQNNVHAVHASDLYMQVMQSAATQTIDDKVIDIQNQLINEYSGTPYAALASLVLAKAEYEKDNVDGAVAQLELAVKYANDDITKQVASLRLASIYLEQKKYDEAMSLLNMKHDAAYDAQYEELKGDVFNARGDTAQARMAYDKAINLQGIAASKWLKLKRQNLGQQSTGQQNMGQGSAENISVTDMSVNSVSV
ncbi:MAG: tetratricopeptide repeat protein [Gammaproteobacteria bacterium]|nr:MAG: tetratricopeptide repeat protein [Gammaproteobacteria bacterium]